MSRPRRPEDKPRTGTAIRIATGHPANAGILDYLCARERLESSVSVARHMPDCSPESIEDPYLRLGTHPDLVSRLWDELTPGLPVDCRWVVYGTPALVNPRSGIVFAFAGGTHTYAFRLPPWEFDEAIRAGASRVHHYPAYPELNVEASTLDLSVIGPEWVFGGWFKDESRWCRVAFDFAANAA
jgi:hypothetical protein